MRGLRDRAILAVLLGCGLRRSEVGALTFTHVQQRDGRWCIVDLVGKHGRVRTAPIPTWVKVSRVLENQLFHVSPFDPLTFTLTVLVLIAAAQLASYVPARRATRVDPMDALRYE